MRHPVVWGLAAVVIILLVGAGVLATRGPELHYEDVRPEIEPIEPEMVALPGGTFMMGNPTGTAEEQPVHEVELSPFSIGKYEVTNREWKRFAEATGRYHPPNPLFWDQLFPRPSGLARSRDVVERRGGIPRLAVQAHR